MDIRPSLFMAAALLLAGTARGEEFEFFEKNVRPVLVESCYPCHSAASGKRKVGLLLDTRQGILSGGDSGPAIVPLDPDNSLLIKAVRYSDKELQMPPKDKRLPQAQIEALTQWVKMGAPDPRVDSNTTPAAIQAPMDMAAARKQWAFHP